jgi:sigma-54 dependent transcriptional regulator, acetoin dehydrogenase operon transcriptional activator AcoR
MGSEVQDALMRHTWPGNVRELRNVISGLHYLSKSRHLTLADLPQEITSTALATEAAAAASQVQDQRLSRAVSLKTAEVMLIENSLAHFNGNISKAAIALGISRPTLYRKIQAFGIATDAAKP